MQPTQTNPQQPEDIALYREALHKLITMGTDIAETIHAQITPDAEPAQNQQSSSPSPARAVRRTIALAQNLGKKSSPSTASPAPSAAPSKPSPIATSTPPKRPRPPDPPRPPPGKKIMPSPDRRVEDSIQGWFWWPRQRPKSRIPPRRTLRPHRHPGWWRIRQRTRNPLDINEIIEEIIDDLGLSTIAGFRPQPLETPNPRRHKNPERPGGSPTQNPNTPKPRAGPDPAAEEAYRQQNIQLCHGPDRPKTVTTP